MRSLCPAGILLKNWLSDANISQEAFAEAIGTVRVSVWRWMVGECAPSAKYAATIEDFTGIPARAWSTRSHDVTSIPMADM